jgi:hypothetical protein
MKREQKGRCMRDLCKKCQRRPVAINYKKEDRIYYRSVCDHCSKNFKNSRPTWLSSGYKKKTACDRCGFKGEVLEQFDVYHIDGNIGNCRYVNLKTVCANCQRLLHKLKLPWKRGDLTPDF